MTNNKAILAGMKELEKQYHVTNLKTFYENLKYYIQLSSIKFTC